MSPIRVITRHSRKILAGIAVGLAILLYFFADRATPSEAVTGESNWLNKQISTLEKQDPSLAKKLEEARMKYGDWSTAVALRAAEEGDKAKPHISMLGKLAQELKEGKIPASIELAQLLRSCGGDSEGFFTAHISVPPVNNMPVYKLPGLENLSAFGDRDIQSLAQAAADGDPNVLPAIRSLGKENQIKLFNVLEQPGYKEVDTVEGPADAAAMLTDPRAMALRGAMLHGMQSPDLQPAPYDPTVLANQKQLKALSPEQKLQLINDIRNPHVLGKSLSSLPPEAKHQAINNLASIFARNAQIRDKEMNLVDVPDYLDPSIQTSLAKLKGLHNYQPLRPDQWCDLSAMGGNLGEFLSPYKIRGTNALWTPEDIQLQRRSGPKDYPGYSSTQILTSASPDADQNLVNDWTKVLTSNLRMNYTQQEGEMGWIPKMTNDQLAPILINLGRLKEYRPDVYNNVVANLQQQFGKIPGTYSRTDRLHVPAYKDQITEDTPMIDYNWEDKLKWWLRQYDNGWLNPSVGKSHNLAGTREMPLDQLPE